MCENHKCNHCVWGWLVDEGLQYCSFWKCIKPGGGYCGENQDGTADGTDVLQSPGSAETTTETDAEPMGG